jgi:phospholipase C
MKRVGLLKTVAGCVIGAGCVVGVPALAHAQTAKADALPQGGNSNDGVTRTPIKHVIYIIGENRTFDHAFATYVPRAGQTVWNLLSEGIINADGTPGPNFTKAQQWKAIDIGVFAEHPHKTDVYHTMPPVDAGTAPTKPFFSTVAQVKATEPALLPANDTLLTTGGINQADNIIDKRFPQNLPDGPFQISRYTAYDSYTSSPVHRFFQMWQQTDCDVGRATVQNPSGCQNDLFPYVETMFGAGSNGAPPPANFADDNQATGEGSTSMGFYNVQAGDMPYFTQLANQYALNDNFHQAIEGGTGANHLMVGFGTTIFYADSNGNPITPPSNQIENPNPMPGTNDWYTQDGYGGGSYVNCADPSQPGIGAIDAYLNSLPYKPFRGGDCRKGAYYLVNNYNPGYLGTGQPAPLGPQIFTVPPSKQRNIGLLLADNHISWKYYGEGWANGAETGEASTYCNICNPFLYSTQIMTNPKLRANLQDITNLYTDLQNGTLPAVSIVKPDGLLDGHPASSKFDLYESFVKKIVQLAQSNPTQWASTAIMITEDEGGGYWDSGYIQPIDFFGDGTRIPLIIVSPYTKGVGMVHSYGDHVSFAKFVEANWGLQTISTESRDNLPNPIVEPANVYAPVNAPAISDLMDAFRFGKH